MSLLNNPFDPAREAALVTGAGNGIGRAIAQALVDAVFHLARDLARQLIAAHEPGSFLFLTSLHADTPRNLPHYSTSKAALAMLVKELAKTFGRFGIRVNALVPGAIAAGGFVADPALAKQIPLGRLGHAGGVPPLALAGPVDRAASPFRGAPLVVAA